MSGVCWCLVSVELGGRGISIGASRCGALGASRGTLHGVEFFLGL